MIGELTIGDQFPDEFLKDKLTTVDFTDAEVTNNLATKYNEFVKC